MHDDILCSFDVSNDELSRIAGNKAQGLSQRVPESVLLPVRQTLFHGEICARDVLIGVRASTVLGVPRQDEGRLLHLPENEPVLDRHPGANLLGPQRALGWLRVWRCLVPVCAAESGVRLLLHFLPGVFR